MLKAGLLFFILHSSFFICAASAQNVPFGDGEELSYSVSYRAKLIPNITVMRVTMRTVAETMNGKPHFHLIGNGKTSGAVKGFFDLNDTFHSWLDAATLLPSRMTGDIQEDNYRAKSTYTYNWKSMTVNTVKRKAGWSADRYATIPLRANSGDAFSLFYRMRNTDVSTLVPGQAYPLELILDDTSRTIYYKFIGREEIRIRKVGTFRALRFTCTMATSDGSTYEEGMAFTMWISDDDNKIPLMIESPIRVGNVRVTLSGYKVLHPLDSMIR
jgi:hypothetical protein